MNGHQIRQVMNHAAFFDRNPEIVARVVSCHFWCSETRKRYVHAHERLTEFVTIRPA